VVRKFSAAVLLCFSLNAQAEESLKFAMAPLMDPREEAAIALPIVDYLSRVTGVKVEYVPQGSWLKYQQGVLQDKFDLVFDEAHLMAWRALTHRHTILFTLQDRDEYLIVARKDDDVITSVKSMTGRRACADSPPHIGILLLQSVFTNPVRQPFFLETPGWQASVEGLLSELCDFTVLPRREFAKVESASPGSLKVILMFNEIPSRGLTASSRVSPVLLERLQIAVFSNEANAPLRPLLRKFDAPGIILAESDDIMRLGMLLKDVIGFGRKLVESINRQTEAQLVQYPDAPHGKIPSLGDAKKVNLKN
jgi:ABC-type phosphate/phosphonate transport system substrate-binding protein